jgi:hypothetical protein
VDLQVDVMIEKVNLNSKGANLLKWVLVHSVTSIATIRDPHQHEWTFLNGVRSAAYPSIKIMRAIVVFQKIGRNHLQGNLTMPLSKASPERVFDKWMPTLRMASALTCLNCKLYLSSGSLIIIERELAPTFCILS